MKKAVYELIINNFRLKKNLKCNVELGEDNILVEYYLVNFDTKQSKKIREDVSLEELIKQIESVLVEWEIHEYKEKIKELKGN